MTGVSVPAITITAIWITQSHRRAEPRCAAERSDEQRMGIAPQSRWLDTEAAAQAGNDGLVIMKNGTKYVSSVVDGDVSRIRPKQTAELIAQNIPSPASMCYDAGANQLVIPMNANNALAFTPLK
jgi:hypothetical protein